MLKLFRQCHEDMQYLRELHDWMVDANHEWTAGVRVLIERRAVLLRDCRPATYVGDARWDLFTPRWVEKIHKAAVYTDTCFTIPAYESVYPEKLYRRYIAKVISYSGLTVQYCMPTWQYALQVLTEVANDPDLQRIVGVTNAETDEDTPLQHSGIC